MKCPVCKGHGGWATPSMLAGCPPHYDRCEHCHGTGSVIEQLGIERLAFDLDALTGLPE